MSTTLTLTEQFIEATQNLALLHPEVTSRNEERRNELLSNCGAGSKSILDSVFSTMLSQNTTDKNAHAAFANLKGAHSTWGSVMRASAASVAALIKVAGLSDTRTERMQAILNILSQEQDNAEEPSMEYLRDMDNDAVKKELSRFKGLGPKTISCVLLFSMGRGEFPVDTHVLRIAKNCGWVSSSETREGAYKVLNKLVPDEIKMDLHCLLVRHGKVCHNCASNNRPQFPPADGPLVCPLRCYSGAKKSYSIKREGEEDEEEGEFPKKKKVKSMKKCTKKSTEKTKKEGKVLKTETTSTPPPPSPPAVSPCPPPVHIKEEM
mmetsp:Transcript_6096/g.12155  ORF Transcript_6096/g.12155 Transcript_6096/m.12155 type:complete len:321 (+) Transcript_6096:147-1109(+)